MYRIDTIDTNGFEEIIISDSDRGDYCSVVPAFGANIRELIIGNESIIDGYNTLEAFRVNDSYQSTFLIPFPNRVSGGRYSFRNSEYTLPKNGVNNALHGFFHNREMVLKEKLVGDKGASLIFAYDYRGSYSGYPFCFNVEITIILNVGGFRCLIEITGEDDKRVPIGAGWHPYFRLGTESIDELKMKLPVCNILELDDNKIPTGKIMPYGFYEDYDYLNREHFDTGFSVPSSHCTVELWSEKRRKGIRVEHERVRGGQCYFQIYTPPSRKSIAIEPMTCAANALNNGLGLETLCRDEKLSSSIKISLLEDLI